MNQRDRIVGIFQIEEIRSIPTINVIINDENVSIGDWISVFHDLSRLFDDLCDEYSANDSSFWDWRSMLIVKGAHVFWCEDHMGEKYVYVALKDKHASYIYSLIDITGSKLVKTE